MKGEPPTQSCSALTVTSANDNPIYHSRRAAERQPPHTKTGRSGSKRQEHQPKAKETRLEHIDAKTWIRNRAFHSCLIHTSVAFPFSFPLPNSRHINSRLPRASPHQNNDDSSNNRQIDRGSPHSVCPAKALTKKKFRQPSARARRQPACTSGARERQKPDPPGRQADQALASRAPPRRILLLLLLLFSYACCCSSPNLHAISQCNADRSGARRNDSESERASRRDVASPAGVGKKRRPKTKANKRTSHARSKAKWKNDQKEKKEKVKTRTELR